MNLATGAAFLSDLDTRLVGWAGRPIVMTLAPLGYRSDVLGATLMIPAKFISDLASVPRAPILWLAVGGRGPRPAVIHDFPYQFGFWFLEDGTKLEVKKSMVDAVFHEALLADPWSGAGPVRAWEMWAGVRININGGVWGNRSRAAVLNPIWSRYGWREQDA